MAQHSRRPQKRRPGRGPQRPASKPGLGWPVILGGVAAVVVLVAGIIAISLSGGEDEAESGNELAQQIAASRESLQAAQIDGLALGNANAPVEVLVFEDFQCPFCVGFTGEVEPAIVDEYVKTGKVKLTFQNYPILGAESDAAAIGSVCAADQGDAWTYALTLFEIQAEAGQASNERLNVGRFDRAALVRAARDSGLDTDEFEACLDSPDAVAEVQEQFQLAQALGVRGTPSFALEGELVRPANIEAWRSLLDSAIESVAAAP